MTSQTRHFRPRDYKFKERSNQRAIEPLPLCLARSISSVELDRAQNLASIERQSRQTETQSRGRVESSNDDNKIFAGNSRCAKSRETCLCPHSDGCSVRFARASFRLWNIEREEKQQLQPEHLWSPRFHVSRLSFHKTEMLRKKPGRLVARFDQLLHRANVGNENELGGKCEFADTAAPVTSTMRNIRSIIYSQSVKFDASIVIMYVSLRQINLCCVMRGCGTRNS